MTKGLVCVDRVVSFDPDEYIAHYRHGRRIRPTTVVLLLRGRDDVYFCFPKKSSAEDVFCDITDQMIKHKPNHA